MHYLTGLGGRKSMKVHIHDVTTRIYRQNMMQSTVESHRDSIIAIMNRSYLVETMLEQGVSQKNLKFSFLRNSESWPRMGNRECGRWKRNDW